MSSLQTLALRHDIGEVIKERYTVRSILGAGAFGTVYRVEETLGTRTVSLACKEMHVLDDVQTAQNERADALRMFQEEAYLLQTLRDPHIPAAHFESARGVWLACPVCGRTFRGVRQCPDHGAVLQVINERYYLLMDFIEGPDLEEKLLAQNGRPLEETRVLDWMLQVCGALETVHAMGFSHRDIKPANIKIREHTPDAPDSQAMLIDFGLVKPSQSEGRYGTLVQRKSTALGTLGYAPVSLEEQQTPDARTDILALGMTMYRLLTALDPTEPDQLAQMRAHNPRHFNQQISEALETVILRAIQIDREARYPDVAALRADLQAARYPIQTTCPHCGHVQNSLQAPDGNARCSRCGRPLLAASGAMPTLAPTALNDNAGRAVSNRAPLAPPSSLPDPYISRIEELESQWQALEKAAPMPQDARLQAIASIFKNAARFTVGVADECPACREATLLVVSGQPNGDCPLCWQAQLRRRDTHLSHCPICRQGALQEFALRPHELFCPLCREVPLSHQEKRAFLGLAVDEHWHCTFCGGDWDVERGGARLESVGHDPYGIGALHRGESWPAEQWRQMSGRADHWFECDHCASQFEPREADALCLMHVGADPFGEGQKWNKQTLTRAQWTQIEQGSAPTAAPVTHDCPHCAAAFYHDREAATLTLEQIGKVAPSALLPPVGRARPLREWYLLARGKRSQHPGRLCPNPRCTSEWNDENAVWRLMFTQIAALRPLIGQARSGEDWRRVALNLPGSEELWRLQNEQKELQAQRERELARWRQGQKAQRESLQNELQDLYQKSALGGFVPLRRMTPAKSADDWRHQNGTFVILPLSVSRSALAVGEILRWESPALRCGVAHDVERNLYQLHPENNGMLVVTQSRLQFVNSLDDRPNQIWHLDLRDLQNVELVQAEKRQVIILRSTSDALTGFEITPTPWTFKKNSTLYPFTVTASDLLEILQTLI